MKIFKYILFLLSLNIGLAKEATTLDPATNLNSIPVPKYHFPATNSFDIRTSLKIKFLEGKKILFFDFHYIRIKQSYLKEYTSWFAKMKRSLVGNWTPTSFDCDNFSLLYKSMLSTAIYKHNKSREILVGIIMVKQKVPALGLPAGDWHSLNIVGTDEGWIVVEPQTGEFINLKEYPNEIVKYIF